MIVYISDGTPPKLQSPEDFNSFKVLLVRTSRFQTTDPSLDGIAELTEDDHAWISRAWILRASGLEQSQEWCTGFAKMLQFAQKQGWIRESDGAIKAHIEYRAAV
jgi:hypothetical protein